MRARLLFVVLLLAINARSGEACSCFFPGPQPCAGLSKTGVVFVGTVIDIENPPPDSRSSEQAASRSADTGEGLSRYRFRVDERISGASQAEIDVYSGRGGGDCSYHFQEGAQYVVFPYQSGKGVWMATLCSPTRPVEAAPALLMELRAMRDHARVASLYGVLRGAPEPYGSGTEDHRGKALPDTRLFLRSENGLMETVTDASGVYAFYDVPAGDYRVDAELPKNLEIAPAVLTGRPPPLKLPNNACFEYDVRALPTSRIRGTVLGPDGKALSYAPVSLYRSDPYEQAELEMAWLELQGAERPYFEFEHVAPGEYLLVYNEDGRSDPDVPFPRTFYPGTTEQAEARPIRVVAGQDVTGIELRLAGGRATRTITVRMIAAAGIIPDIIYVAVEGEDGSSPGETKVSTGLYLFNLFPGVRYQLWGAGYCSATHSESKTDTVFVDGSGGGSEEVVLTFPAPGCQKLPGDTGRDADEGSASVR